MKKITEDTTTILDAEYNKKFDTLKTAACSGQFETLKTLKERMKKEDFKELLNIKNGGSSEPLFLAALNGHIKCLEFLIENLKDEEGNINSIDIFKFFKNNKFIETILTFAASMRDIEIFKSLKNNLKEDDLKKLINIPNKNNLSPLFIATERCHLECVEFLIENLKDEEGNINSFDTFKYLKGDKVIHTVLTVTASMRNIEIFKSLKDNLKEDDFKKLINIPNDNNELALLLYAKNRHFDCFEFLTNVSNLNKIDQNGNNILHYIISYFPEKDVKKYAEDKNIKDLLEKQNKKNISVQNIIDNNKELFNHDNKYPIAKSTSAKNIFFEVVNNNTYIATLGIIDTERQTNVNCVSEWESRERGSIIGMVKVLKAIKKYTKSDLTIEIVNKLHSVFYEEYKYGNNVSAIGKTNDNDSSYSEYILSCNDNTMSNIKDQLEEITNKSGNKFTPYLIKDELGKTIIRSHPDCKKFLEWLIDDHNKTLNNPDATFANQVESIFNLVLHGQRAHYFSDFNGRLFYCAILNLVLIKNDIYPVLFNNPNIIDEIDFDTFLQLLPKGQINFNNLHKLKTINVTYQNPENLLKKYNKELLCNNSYYSKNPSFISEEESDSSLSDLSDSSDNENTDITGNQVDLSVSEHMI